MEMGGKSDAPDFLPGEAIEVVDGTFAGMSGLVVTREHAQVVRKRSGGERMRPLPGHLWVVLTVFDRPMCFYLHHTQVQRARQP